MTQTARADSAGALVDELEHNGKASAPEWISGLRAVLRHKFIPEFYERHGVEWHRVSADSGPQRWWERVYSDASLVTQLGTLPNGAFGPTSSSSTPGLMERSHRHTTMTEERSWSSPVPWFLACLEMPGAVQFGYSPDEHTGAPDHPLPELHGRFVGRGLPRCDRRWRPSRLGRRPVRAVVHSGAREGFLVRERVSELVPPRPDGHRGAPAGLAGQPGTAELGAARPNAAPALTPLAAPAPRVLSCARPSPLPGRG